MTHESRTLLPTSNIVTYILRFTFQQIISSKASLVTKMLLRKETVPYDSTCVR